jgi:hypothetical protein
MRCRRRALSRRRSGPGSGSVSERPRALRSLRSSFAFNAADTRSAWSRLQTYEVIADGPIMQYGQRTPPGRYGRGRVYSPRLSQWRAIGRARVLRIGRRIRRSWSNESSIAIIAGGLGAAMCRCD